MKLRIASDLALPLEAVTQTFGILGKRGSGKSNAGRVMAEEMSRAGLPFCVIDPVGAWWGLRSSGDGKGPGLSIPIFGGDHGDIPLEREAGPLLADVIVDQRLSSVLDISVFSEGDKVRFLIDFAERLFQRNRDPLHLFLEESDDFIPQRFLGEKARLVGAWQRIVKRGRGRGLGATMITQRSAALNKDVLTQCETLLVFRTTAPQDMKAIEGWLQYHGQKTDVLASLPSLKDGEAWVWSPHWMGKLARVQIRLSETFDSGATPTDVKGRRAPATLADVDLGALRERMAATIQRAKAEDPKELRREISRLRGENARFQRERPSAEIQRVEVPVLDEATVKRVEAALLEAEGFADALRRVAGQVIEGTAQAQRALDAARQVRPMAPMAGARRFRAAPKADVPERRAGSSPAASIAQDEGLGKGEFRVLTAVAQHPEGVTREQVTILTGYKRSTRDTYLQRLRAAGFVVVGERIEATAEGRAALGRGFEPLPVGDALREHWIGRLPEGERKILQVVLDAYPRAVDRERISEVTGYARSSRDTYLQRLRARRLVETDRGSVRAADDLFDLQRSDR